jgi:CotH kinase protein
VKVAAPLIGAALWVALTVAPPVAGADEAASLFDPASVVEIDLELPADSRDALALDPAEYVDATFTLSGPGIDYGPVAIGARLKGSASFRRLSGKAAFKLKFGHTVKGQRFLGLKTLTLNNMVQDPSMVHELLAYEAFRAVGVAAPRTGYAYLRVNGDDYGVYLNIETPDDVFLSRWFPSTGHLYEAEVADLVPADAERFAVDEGDESDLADLEGLIAAVNDPADGWTERVAPLADLEEITRMWAVEKYIGHRDGYVGNRNNYYLHSDTAGRFSMLPWGTDQSWIWGWRLPFGTDAALGRMFHRCLADSTCEAMYRVALDDVRATVAALDLEELATSTAEMLRPWQIADPRREQSLARIDEVVVETLAFLRARPLDTNWSFPLPEDGSDPGPAPPVVATPPESSAVTSLGPRIRAMADRVRTLVRRQGLRGLANGFSHLHAADRAGIVIEEVFAPARVLVARGAKRFSGPGRGRIYIRPTGAARRTLRGKTALELTVRITFDPAGRERPIRRSTVARVKCLCLNGAADGRARALESISP